MPNITKPIGLSNIWANGGTKIDPGAAKVNIGWVVQLPPYEYQNWVDNRQDQAIAHISQHGIPEWDSATEYQGLLSYTQGSDGVIYKCKQTNTNKDPSNTLNGQYWAVAFETFGSVAAVQALLNAHILNYQTLSSIGNVGAARSNLSVYSKSESDARFASLNGNSSQVFSVGLATQPQHAVRLSQVAGLITQATESTTGVVRLATTGVTEQGTDDLTAITPLKASTVYLKKSANLAGLTNVATARANLGLGSMATQNVGSFLQAGNNLSEILNFAAARNNLGLSSTATQPESYFLRSGLNLTDLTNVGQARNSLGLTQTAIWPLADLMQKGENLAGLTSLSTARANLGLGSAALSNSSDFLLRGNNLADLTNNQDARNNLGLGNLAVLNVFGLGGANLDFTKSLGGTGEGYFRINDIVVNYGRFSVAPRGARITVTFSLRISNTLFAGVLPDGAATEQMGTSNITNVGMTIGTGIGDGSARTGYWFHVGTA